MSLSSIRAWLTTVRDFGRWSGMDVSLTSYILLDPPLVISTWATSVVEMLLHSGGFALAILDSLIHISLIEKTNHDVLIATVH